MSWKLDKDRPLCPQIGEHICVMIAKGEVKSGQRIPSVRDIAVQAGINPNTVQKALEQLETQGVIYSIRGSGWYASEKVGLAKKVLERMAKQKTKEYFYEMALLNFTPQQVKQIVEEWDDE